MRPSSVPGAPRQNATSDKYKRVSDTLRMTQVEPLWQTHDSASIPHPRHTLTDPHGYKQHLRPQQNMPRDKKIQTHNAARLRIYGSAQTGRLGPPSAPGVRVPRCMVFQTRWGNTLRIPQTEHLVMTPRPPITHKHTHADTSTHNHTHTTSSHIHTQHAVAPAKGTPATQRSKRSTTSTCVRTLQVEPS